MSQRQGVIEYPLNIIIMIIIFITVDTFWYWSICHKFFPSMLPKDNVAAQLQLLGSLAKVPAYELLMSASDISSINLSNVVFALSLWFKSV